MKRFIILLSVVLFGQTLNAQNNKSEIPNTGTSLEIKKAKKGKVALRSGDLMLFTKKENSAQVLMDYSKTKIEGKPVMTYLKDRGEKNVADWPEETRNVLEWYVKALNKSFRRGMEFFEESQQDITHKMIVRVIDLDLGNMAAGFIPSFNVKSGGAIATAVIEMYNVKTKKVDCVIEVNQYQGLYDRTEERRRKETARRIAYKIEDLVEDAEDGEDD